MDIKSILSRIKWKSVVAVILFIVIIFFAFKNLPSQHKVKDDLGVSAVVDPDVIGPGGKSAIDIEIENFNKDEDVDVIVTAKSYDEKLVFYEFYNTTVQREIKVGPTEIRKLKFKVKLQPGALEGKYRIDVEAKEKNKGSGAEYQVYLTVEESA